MDALLVTLVSGLTAADRTPVARALAGLGPSTVPGEPMADGSDDVGEFALRLADELGEAADALGAARGAASGMAGAAGGLASAPGARDLVVELPPEADPVEVALVLETVFRQRGAGERPILIRDIVSVTSVAEVRRWLWAAESADPDGADDFESAERLAILLEFATRVVVVDADGAHEADLAEVYALVNRLNPLASVVPARWAEGRRGPFRPVKGGVARSLGRSMGWQLELAGRAPRGLRRDAVDVVVYREALPFHPARLAVAVRDGLLPEKVGRILRSRGLVQLASRAGTVGAWLTAGDTLTIEPTSLATWDLEAPIGQEIVFIGAGLRPSALRSALDACVLTPDELLAGPALWAELHDPFPAL